MNFISKCILNTYYRLVPDPAQNYLFRKDEDMKISCLTSGIYPKNQPRTSGKRLEWQTFKLGSKPDYH